MVTFDTRPTSYKPSKFIPFEWNTFRSGLNILLRENELAPDELAQADNILLKGKGIPTKRWGTANYFSAGNASSSTRGLKGFYKSDQTTNELLSLTDDGYLVKKNGSSFTTLNGASWASGNNAYMTQLNDTIYIVNGQRELTKYSSPTLVGFATIAVPVITGASNLSNATGTTTKGYRITAVSQVGETLSSGTFELKNQPAVLGGLAGGTIRLTFTGVSTASGILQGFNIYGRDSGNETFISSENPTSTTYDDNGAALPRLYAYPPLSDSTGGPKAKYIARFQDRLVFAGISGEPSKVLISGKVPNHEKFDVSFGGTYIRIEPDAGDDIVQLSTFRDRIIVFKQRSIWQITLGTDQIGNFFVTVPILSLITASHGCIAPRSVAAVRDDIYYLSRKGVYSVGYQLGYTFDILRTNELSLKVRPFFNSLTVAQLQNSVASYFDFKYIISFPGLDKTLIFDVERGAWLGPWTRDANIFEIYYDSTNGEHLLFGDDDGSAIDEFSENFTNDKGAAIPTILRTRQEDFGDWSLFKNIRNIFTQFRNVTGSVSVDIRLETRSGSVLTAKNFTVTPATGNSGWGSFVWANTTWGNSVAGGGGIDAQQTIRWNNLNKAARTIQLTFSTSNAVDNYELLGVRGDAKPIGSGFRPSSWRV